MKIIVFGDIILDINHQVTTAKKAAEADIPVYAVNETRYILGGASNVANILNGLGCDTTLVSTKSTDIYSETVQILLDEKKIKNKLFVTSHKTTQKYRLFMDNRIIHRYDIEDTDYMDMEKMELDIFNYLQEISHIDGFIISDYDKGFLSPSFTENLIEYANKKGIYTFVDPKIRNNQKYKDCFLLKPNYLEGSQLTGKTDKKEIINILKTNLSCQTVLLTDGKYGMTLYDGHRTYDIKQSTRDVVDVTGAGDVVISLISYLFIQTKDLLLSAKIANSIAGKSVQYVGNYTPSIDDIREYQYLEDKIITQTDNQKISYLRNAYKNIVFTNGCFDILHSAHIQLLSFAKKQGDILIVGLNSDASIQKLKGKDRPINDIEERMDILKSMNFIDYVVVFEEETPYEIIKKIKPDILVKGGDYNINTIIGKEFVKEVLFFDYIPNKSTTQLIHKISEKNKKC